MKHNYFLYIVLFIFIIFRGTFIGFINNINKLIFIKDNNLEINILNKRIAELENDYNELLDFKNNININYNYIISNVYMNNYSYDRLLISGNNYQINDEVVSSDGLIGLISNKYSNYSEIKYIYDTNIVVKINNDTGKIISKDENSNLIIKELSNYNSININDKVYSSNNTYIGKVIMINKEDIDTKVIVKTVNLKDIKYVAVISRQL